MDRTYNTNNIWTTNNGFTIQNRRPNTPANLSYHSTISDQISTRGQSATAVDHVNPNSNRSKSPPALYNYQNNNLVGVESRFRRKYYNNKTLFILLIVLIILLLIAIIVLSVLLSKNGVSTICRTNECVRTAASLIYTMDQETDPCEDFYQFTCGRWSDEHPRPDSLTSNDWFRERQSKIMRQLRQFLKQNITDDQPEAVAKAKIMYKACMDTHTLEKKGLEPVLYFLRKFKLPIIPSGFNFTLSPQSANKYNKSEKFNWLQSMVLIKKHFSMDLMIGFDIFADPLNRTINRIALGTPEADSALPFNNEDVNKILKKIRKKFILSDDNDHGGDGGNEDDIESREEDEEEEEEEEEDSNEISSGLKAYVSYLKKVLGIYILYLDPDVKTDVIEENIEKMTVNAVKVSKRVFKLKSEAENSTKPSQSPLDDILYISVEELQNYTDKLILPKTLPIWEVYLQFMMADTGNVKNGKFNTTDLIIITSNADIMYLQTLTEYLMQVPPTHLEFYVWLSAVEELILHTTSEMRLLHAEYMRQLIGTEGSSPRSLYCANGINTLMGMALSYALADDDFTRHKLPNVQRMLNDIRRSFNNLVRTTTWMDEPTKYETLQKSAEMKSFIGYPDWITNATALNGYYDGVKINATTHLENMMGVLYWQTQLKLNDLNVPERFGWATSPSHVNAFHTFQANAITLNYGSIGTILGHELTHGFDDNGRMFDKNGNMVQWWSNETINEYINRTECFIEQYNHYYLSDIEEYINGELTLGENIADNGGMREAFYAYRLFVAENGREKTKLPGLEHFSHEQLFFISFGNLWCETYTPTATRYALEDSHCPGKVRLKGVLSNSQEFANTFNCPRGSGMNPHEPKCRIW